MENRETIFFYGYFKFILIGDSAVGKSNILLRYSQLQFRDDYLMTVGVEFGAKNVEIKNKIYRIQIWDTAGKETYKTIKMAYYQNSVCAIVVYDISCKSSFNNASTWIEECKNICPKVFMVLVGNKSDLANTRQVNFEEGQKLADKSGIQFYETSAKTGENIEIIFFNSVEEIAKKKDQGYYNLEDNSCGIKIGKIEANTILTTKKVSDEIDKSKIKKENKKNELDGNNKDGIIKLKNEKIEELNKRINLLEIELNEAKKYNEELILINNKLKKQNEENSNLINEEKRKIKELNLKIIKYQNMDKMNPSYDKIMTLMEKLENKEYEIKELKSKLPFELSKNEKILTVIFNSTDQKIHYSLIWKNNYVFNRLENTLYNIYPEYKETENYFTSNGIRINKCKTLEENNIKYSDVITLNKYEIE